MFHPFNLSFDQLHSSLIILLRFLQNPFHLSASLGIKVPQTERQYNRCVTLSTFLFIAYFSPVEEYN